MTVTDVLTLCDARGVQLSIDGHELRARGRKGAVNDVLKQGIVQYKAELIEALYEREERLAIQEEGQPPGFFVDNTLPDEIIIPVTVPNTLEAISACIDAQRIEVAA
jgi:hypothetical protein